jgi:hypothetical protein
VSATGVSGVGQMTSACKVRPDCQRQSLTSAAPDPAAQGLTFTMVSKKVNNCDKWMDDKHTDYPPSFCFISNLFISGRINNHPYFKSENQYSNYKDNWQPCTQVQHMVSIHTCIIMAARAAGPAPGPGAASRSGAAGRSAAVLLSALPGRSRQSSAARPAPGPRSSDLDAKCQNSASPPPSSR